MTVTNKNKPVVDLDTIEKARLEEETNADKIIEKAEEEEEVIETPKKKEEIIPEKPIDWEAKFKASTQEAMLLTEKLRLQEEEKNKKVEITDEFLKAKYSDWEDMTLGEQRAIKNSEVLAQEVQDLKNKNTQFDTNRQWVEKVDAWIAEEMPDLFPKLIGREEEFKRFVTNQTRRGIPLDFQAKTFLYDNPTTEKKRSLFHPPGGEPPAPKNEGMSADEAAELMRTRPGEYVRLIRAKKLNIKI